MKNLILLMTFLSLISCEDFNGQFNSSKTLQLKDGKSIAPGIYSAEVKIKGKKKLKLKLKNSYLDEKIKIKLDQDLEKLMIGGQIDIPSHSNDQQLAISGSLKKNTTYSNSINSIETCSLYVPRRQCKKVCVEHRPSKKPNGPRSRKPRKKKHPKVTCKRVCKRVNVLVVGSKEVQYHYSTQAQYLDLSISSASGKFIGDFSGSSSDSHKSYDYVGQCYL